MCTTPAASSRPAAFALALVALLLLPAVAGAALRVEVRDAGDGRPLADTLVEARREGGVRLGQTGPGGILLLELEPGEWAVSARHTGYEPYTGQVELTAGEDHRLEIGLEARGRRLEVVEILGEAPATYERTAGAASRMPAEQVQLIQPLGTQELLQKLPGVHGFADDGIGNSRISVGIRGLYPRRSSRVLVLEDGVPIQPAIYVYPNMYYNPPSERLESIELIKGSAAIQDGPQTMGGVINYVTKRPRHLLGGLTRITAGTNGYAAFFGELGGFGNDRVQPELQLLFKRGDGFRENNAFDQLNGTFKLGVDFDADRHLYVKANSNYENSAATYTGLTEYSFEVDPDFNPKEHDNFELFRGSLDAIYTHYLSGRVTQNTLAYWSYFDRDWWRENDVFVDADSWDGETVHPVPWFTPGDLVRVGNGQDNFGILRTFYTAGVEHSYEVAHSLAGHDAVLDIGARVHWEKFLDDRKVGDAPDARDGVYYYGNPDSVETLRIVGQSQHYETRALALYGAEEIQLGRLVLEPGLRLELFEQSQVDRLQGSRLQDALTTVVLPGLGFNYRVGGSNVFGGVHRGYTPPSSGTLRVVNFGQDVPSGGLDLEAEKSWNTELGVRGNQGALSYELAGFGIFIEDLVAAGRGTVFTNLGSVRNLGVELSGSLEASRWHDALPDLQLSYSYLNTEITEGRVASALLAGGGEVDISGNEMPYAPEHQLVVGLSKELGERVRVRVGMRTVDEVFTDFENIPDDHPGLNYNRGDTGPIPAYTVFDASGIVRLGGGWELFGAAKNFTDEVYIGSRLHSNPGQPEANASSGILVGPRRQINLGLAYKF